MKTKPCVKQKQGKKTYFAWPISQNYGKMIEELCPIFHRQIVFFLSKTIPVR